MNLHLKGGKAVKYTRYCERDNIGGFHDPCWVGSVMEDSSCSGGSIHVASGGQVVLMGVTFGDNTAYGYANKQVWKDKYTCPFPKLRDEGAYDLGLNVFVEPNNSPDIYPIFALNVDNTLVFIPSTSPTGEEATGSMKEFIEGFASQPLPEKCSAAATGMCRKFFHRKNCLGSTTDSTRTKSNMYCGGPCMPGHFGEKLTQHSDNMSTSVCKACPPGQYQANEGQRHARCVRLESIIVHRRKLVHPVPRSSTSPRGSTKRSDCKTDSCGFGNELLTDRTCVVCPKGKYSDETPDINSCKDCLRTRSTRTMASLPRTTTLPMIVTLRINASDAL